VIVRINDRGPFHNDRIIDLSYAAAYKMRLLEKGSGMVEVEAIDTRDPTQKRAKDLTLTIPPSPPPPVFVDIPSHSELEFNTPIAGKTPASAATKPTSGKKPRDSEAGSKPNTASGDYVQVGVFKQKANADGIRAKLQEKNLAENVPLESWYNAGTYRVRLGPYPSRQDAESAAASIKQALGANAIIIHQQ
jgi:rare lipoprotein A